MLHQERELLKFSRNIFFTLRKKVVKEVKESHVSIASDKKQKEIVVNLSSNTSIRCYSASILPIHLLVKHQNESMSSIL